MANASGICTRQPRITGTEAALFFTTYLCALPDDARMDLLFIGLIIVLALSTWAGIVLCERLMRQP